MDGRRFRTSHWWITGRHSPLVEPNFRLTGTKTVVMLERVANQHRYPRMITADNGSEFASKALDACPTSMGSS